MGLTVIRAVVNMSPYLVSLSEEGSEIPPMNPRVAGAPPGSTVRRFDSVATDIRVPWCTSQGDFDRRHLQLSFLVSGGLGFRVVSYYTIWQQAIRSVDLVRFNRNGLYVNNAGGLAAFRAGVPLYTVTGDSDCILVVDEQQRVILTRLTRS